MFGGKWIISEISVLGFGPNASSSLNFSEATFDYNFKVAALAAVFGSEPSA